MTLTATFEIHYSAFLDANGKVLQDLPEFAKNTDTLIQLYRWMKITRQFDTKAVALQRTGKLGTYASPLGQEAIGVGIGHAMQKEDVLCPAYREYAAMFQRGVKLSDIFSYWGGDERGSDFQDARQDMPLCVPIATQCLHAAGIAKAFQYRKQPRVSVSVIGDGGTSQGDFYEALNVAGIWNLPTVFVINNNQWAISVPITKQTATQTLAQKGIAAGIHSERVDGNDVIAVTHAMNNALARARQGKGPSVIEAITYRLCDHTTADDASRYADKAIADEAWKKEPILRLKLYLTAQNVWDEAKETALDNEIKQLIQDAVAEYESRPPQPPEAMLDYLYAQLPDALADQYAELVAIGE
ncbi:MAG: pyruvate dehydrogenase (acetyl-transferring) E1 component subunit alpha [Legionellales bacterium]|nr:pyruvate dehydrogenase (acetyl-transferring) E1 component subunit alpha [Legionellales bacterium]